MLMVLTWEDLSRRTEVYCRCREDRESRVESAVYSLKMKMLVNPLKTSGCCLLEDLHRRWLGWEVPKINLGSA